MPISLGGDEKDILHCVCCLVSIAQHGGGRVVEASGEAIVDACERLAIPGRVGADQLGVGTRVGHV